MTATKLTKHIVALAVLGVMAIGVLLISPFAFHAREDHIAEAQATLAQKAKFEAVRASSDSMKLEAESLTALLASEPSIFNAPSLVVAQDLLQSRLRAAIEASGGQLLGFNFEPALSSGTLQQLRVSAQFQVQEIRLPDLLLQIEQQAPQLYTNKLTMTGPHMMDPAATNPTLNLTGEFAAFVRTEAAK